MSALVEQVNQKLAETDNILVTAESCTGGLIAAAITELSGSSSVFDRGFVTYSNEAKIANLSVSPETLHRYGAVSEQTAKEMALGALNNSHGTIAISVTGIAGPTGGSDEKPVGLVYIGLCKKDEEPIAIKNNFDGDRTSVRTQTVETALNLILENLA
ncbi:MAG: CinA family protein [Pseudomonadota bacterium]